MYPSWAFWVVEEPTLAVVEGPAVASSSEGPWSIPVLVAAVAVVVDTAAVGSDSSFSSPAWLFGCLSV